MKFAQKLPPGPSLRYRRNLGGYDQDYNLNKDALGANNVSVQPIVLASFENLHLLVPVFI